MNQGWIKIWRKIDECWFRNKPDYFSVWIYLLTEASHLDKEITINSKPMLLKAGSFITSRKKIAKKTGVNERQVERILLSLGLSQQMSQQNLFTCRLISITNWDEYQNVAQQMSHSLSHNQEYSRDTTPSSLESGENLSSLKSEDGLTRFFKGKGNGKGNPIREDFDIFWLNYPRKEGKQDALKEWLKAKPKLEVVLKALEWQKKSVQWLKEDGQYIPQPRKWLHAGNWENEPIEKEKDDGPGPRYINS